MTKPKGNGTKRKVKATAAKAKVPAKGPTIATSASPKAAPMSAGPKAASKAPTIPTKQEPKEDPRKFGGRLFVENYKPSTDVLDPMRDRVRGAVMWSAYGDSCGMPFEGQAPFQIFKRAKGWVDGLHDPSNNFDRYLSRGGWTDDTQLKLAILQSMIDCDAEIDMDDIAHHHVRMLDAGPRGWGSSTRDSVTRLKRGKGWKESGQVGGAGNGIPMKISPVGLKYGLLYGDEIKAGTFKYGGLARDCRNIAVMTHRDSRAVISGIIHSVLVAWAINDVDPLENWDRLVRMITRLEEHFPKEADTLSERFEHIPANLGKGPEYFAHLFRTGCFVVESYPFSVATYLIYRKDVVGGILAAVNAGGDCDSTAAMVGDLCGAEAGLGIEDRTLALEEHDNLLGTIDAFYDAVRASSPGIL
jgi:ADP-ribosylglycohydrolase